MLQPCCWIHPEQFAVVRLRAYFWSYHSLRAGVKANALIKGRVRSHVQVPATGPEANVAAVVAQSNHLSPSLGRVPVTVEQAINECAERRLRVTAI
jgi:hypothetical protein